jgi:hypothetical protein
VRSTIRSTEDLRYWCLLQTEVLGLIRKAHPFHFCKRGDVQLGDGGVLQLLADVLAEPPAPRLVSDNRLLGWRWVKSYPDDPIADDYYQREVEESTRDWQEGPPDPPEASDYEELVDFLWAAVRELAGEAGERPPRPAAVPNMGVWQHALDVVHTWCCKNNLRVKRDGPFPPDQFRLHGTPYGPFSRKEYLLLGCLWNESGGLPKDPVPRDEVIRHIFGTGKGNPEALRTAVWRLNERLTDLHCPAEVVTANRHLRLDLFPHGGPGKGTKKSRM